MPRADPNPVPAEPPAGLGVGTPGEVGRAIRTHGRRKSRVPKWAILAVVIGLAAVAVGLRLVPESPFADQDTAEALAPLPLHPVEITAAAVGTSGFLSWALLDRRTNEIVGSTNLQELSDTASMIKIWLAADYLRLATEANRTPPAAAMRDLEIMVKDSDNDAADRTYSAIGGTAGVQQMVSVCGLTDSSSVPGRWSNTIMSARDAVRLGQCVADGRAAGTKWTPWLLDAMRGVRGDGNFGIRKAFPADQQSQIAIKNGWLLRTEDELWHTNCLAVGDTWVLAVMQRYPAQGNYIADFTHTGQVCQNVTTQLLNAPTPAP
jgi:hypothetical protein